MRAKPFARSLTRRKCLENISHYYYDDEFSHSEGINGGGMLCQAPF